MNVQTRQRLIGFLLLLLLAVTLTPLLLRSPDQVQATLDHRIPEPPEADVPKPAPVVDEQQQQALTQSIETDRRDVAEAAAAPAPDKRPPQPEAETGPAPVTAGFTVQVASFSDPGNAESLVSRLKAAGYSAYHRRVAQDGNVWQRVFVGPEIKRADAQALQKQLADDKRFALSPGLVRTYIP